VPIATDNNAERVSLTEATSLLARRVELVRSLVTDKRVDFQRHALPAAEGLRERLDDAAQAALGPGDDGFRTAIAFALAAADVGAAVMAIEAGELRVARGDLANALYELESLDSSARIE
jgi:hypothetical protein